MVDLRPMNCVNCGGVINPTTLVCEHCGTAYRFDDRHRLRLVHSPMEFETLHGMIVLPAFYVEHDPEKMMNCALEEMAKNMAAQILPFIQYRVSFDMRQQEYGVHGRLNVGVPNTLEGSFYKKPRLNDRGMPFVDVFSD